MCEIVKELHDLLVVVATLLEVELYSAPKNVVILVLLDEVALYECSLEGRINLLLFRLRVYCQEVG